MSLVARLFNVFAIPGEVFAGVKARRGSIGNWLVPALLSAVVGTFAAVVILSQPANHDQMRAQQAKLMAKQVQAGTLTRAQGDQMLALVEKLTVPIAAMLTVAASVVRVLWWALVLRLLGLIFLRVRLSYSKLLEVAGLGTMISVLGAAVTLLLTVKLGTAGTSGFGIVISDLDAVEKSPVLLGVATVFSVWLVGVMSVGLAKLAGVPLLRAAWPVLAYWLLQESILGSLGQLAR